MAIRIILFLLIALAPAAAFCGELTLAWTENTESDIVGYRIFCRAENSSYNYSQPSWEGSETTCVINNLDDNKVYYSIVRAYNTAGVESLNSNEVSAQITSSDSSSSDSSSSDSSSSDSSSSGSSSSGSSSSDSSSSGSSSSDSSSSDSSSSDYSSSDSSSSDAGSSDQELPDSPSEFIIDNGDPGTSWDGSWNISGGSGSYGNKGVYSKDPDATYTFEKALTGYYEVSLRWTCYYTRCTDVNIDIYDGDYLIASTEVDQQSDGNQWNAIGEFELTDTARVVIRSGSGDCTTFVDGIRFVLVHSSPPEIIPEIIIDNGDPGTSWDGSWKTSGGPNSYENTSVYSKDYGATYTFEKALSGYYEVSLWWTYYSNRCTSVDIDIYDGNSLLETIEVNQKTDAGQWNVLGEYEFRDTARVVIHNNRGGCSTNADGVRFVADDTRFVSAYDDTFQTSSSCQASPILNENSFYKSAVEGETVTLDDVDNLKTDYNIVEYYWEQLAGEPVALSDSSAAVPTFTAPVVDENGTELIFAVEVKTPDDLCDTAEIAIDIEDYNDRNYTETSGTSDSGGCFISINTGSILGSFSKKAFLFYNVMILLLAILSLCLIYSLSKKIGRKF